MKLGRRQIECLERFLEAGRFTPTRKGEPWSEMKSLINRGLMWSRKSAESLEPRPNQISFLACSMS